MLKTFAMLALLLGSSFSAAQDWSCSASAQPPECSGNVQTKFSSLENTCLLKLYTCGRYQDIVARMDTMKIGLAPEHNYYLGAAYFGLSNRTDAQSLKCHYFRRAKAQIEEFLIGIDSNPASEVSYGGEQRMDIIYQATRLSDLLKKESGCVESSFSEGTIYRMARLMTQDQMKSLLHRSTDGDDPMKGSKAAAQEGFGSMRESMNSFVTKTSQLESRYFLYEAQRKASENQLNDLTGKLQGKLGADAIVVKAGDMGLPTVEIRMDAINKLMLAMQQQLDGQAIAPLESYKAITDLYFKNINPNDPKKTLVYDELREEKLAEVKGLLSLFALYTNTIRVKTPEAEAVHDALAVEGPGFETPVLVGEPLKEFFQLIRGPTCTPFLKKNYWYCPK